jgi:hypothetical protein
MRFGTNSVINAEQNQFVIFDETVVARGLQVFVAAESRFLYTTIEMPGRRARCPDCDTGFLQGDGKCSTCHGSGVNVHLNSDEPNCEKCNGTGICQACGGSGVSGIETGSDFIDLLPGE